MFGEIVAVAATLEDSVNLETGDMIASTSIDELIGGDGQLIMTKTLSPTQFRQLVADVRQSKTLHENPI